MPCSRSIINAIVQPGSRQKNRNTLVQPCILALQPGIYTGDRSALGQLSRSLSFFLPAIKGLERNIQSRQAGLHPPQGAGGIAVYYLGDVDDRDDHRLSADPTCQEPANWL